MPVLLINRKPRDTAIWGDWGIQVANKGLILFHYWKVIEETSLSTYFVPKGRQRNGRSGLRLC